MPNSTIEQAARGVDIASAPIYGEPATKPNPAIRVAFVLHAMQVAGAEVLVKETIQRLGQRILPTIFCLDHVGPLGERLRRDGVDVHCFHRRPGRDWRVAWR